MPCYYVMLIPITTTFFLFFLQVRRRLEMAEREPEGLRLTIARRRRQALARAITNGVAGRFGGKWGRGAGHPVPRIMCASRLNTTQIQFIQDINSVLPVLHPEQIVRMKPRGCWVWHFRLLHLC